MLHTSSRSVLASTLLVCAASAQTLTWGPVLPSVSPNDVSVQLYAGRISAYGQIEGPEAHEMQHAKEIAPNRHLFTGTIECRTSGRQGFAIRVLPGHVDMASPFEPGLITWN